MRYYVAGRLACLLLVANCLSAAIVKGKVVDSSGAPVPGAQVSVVSRVGVEAQTATLLNGTFEIDTPDANGAKLVVAAPGFSTRTVSMDQAGSIALEIAPLVDAVQVVGSAIEAPATEQGGSFSIIPRGQVRQRNEAYAMDLLRYLPGVTFNQSGSAGAVTSLFVRGGNSNFTLVQIDGAPVNAFGGSFDFAHIPSEALDHIEMIRGPQSSVYGPYANSGVINFVTRRPESSAQLDLLAEGGSYRERRFGITGTGTAAGFGILASASRFDTDGPVTNSDYRNENVLLNITRRGLALHGGFDSNVVGQPGAWGSNPKGTFRGIDRISRARNNTSDYGARYGWNLGSRVRQEVSGSFFLNNNGYRSPFGFSFNKDLRGQGEARTIVSVAHHYTVAFGVSAMREEVKNSFITDEGFSTFPIKRNDAAVYLENRFEFRGRFFLNAGVRGEWIRIPSIPGDGFSRPVFPSSNIGRANPKLAAAWMVASGTRLHSSFGMGIRPPTGFELAFTNNPGLRPERTRSVDAGIEQKLFQNLLLLDATYFYNRYYDLIVTLGGSLSTLSHYKSANLANSRAQGAEFSASLRPARWVFVTGSYTLLETKILSLDGSDRAPLPFAVGQQLTRRPEHSGNFVATFSRGRLTADLTGYFRGRTLYEEPGLGATNGLFWNSGFANLGINLNYALGHGVTAYGNLRNALNRHYEEIYGFPSPRLNFVSGLKWTISRAR
jgi:outer membrane receptor protein involved in Fe transport